MIDDQAARVPQGDILGRHRAFARLAQGGMADIYLAVTEGAAGVTKTVVIKRLRRDVDVENEARFRAMFYDEARLTTQLNHPNIVQTYEVGEDHGDLFLVMEYAEGHTLQEVARLGLQPHGPRLSHRLVARIVSEVLAGLHYAHELNDLDGKPLEIVHRDVSPQNIIVGYDGRVRLLDFGIAKAALQTSLTEVGMLKGKVRYMSPEHVSPDGKIDRRADVFSVGVVLWELVARQRLFANDTSVSSLVALMNPAIRARRLSEVVPDVDSDLERIVEKALDKSVDARYATALEMREDLARYLSKSPMPTELDGVGTFMSTHFAEARKALQSSIRQQLLALQAHAEGRGRNTGRLEGLVDLRPGPEGSGAVGEGTAPLSVPASGIRPTAEQPSMPPQASEEIPVDVAPLSHAGSTDRRPLLIGGGILFLLGALVAIGLALLLRTPAERTATPVVVPNVPGSATAADPTTPSASGSLALTEAPHPAPTTVTDARPRAAWTAPPNAGKTWPPAARPGTQLPTPAVLPSTSAPASAEPAPPKEAGFLTIDTYPWTRVSEGGRVLGNTPLVRVSLSPGTHVLTLDNPGENIQRTTTVTIKSGETVSRRLAF